MAPPDLELEHAPGPRRRGRPPLTAYDLAKLAFFAGGLPRNGFGSIDATSRCNLSCRHCYWLAHDHPAELSVDQWVARLEELRRACPPWEFPRFNCSWVGGEPLLRPELIERCRRYFRYNTVVTNGTIPLPPWPDVNWYVSIDGDEQVHDQLRGRRGSYARALRNVRRRGPNRVTVAYCVSRPNVGCIERVTRDWYAAGADHITFDFYTPLDGIDDALWLPPAERDRVIDVLVALRRIYGEFFIIPERVLELMRSPRCLEVTRGCLLRRRGFALDAAGRSKGKCVMGERADCDRCGCVVPYYLRALTDRRMIVGELARAALRRSAGAAQSLLALGEVGS